jgi:predicted transcriptional regulator
MGYYENIYIYIKSSIGVDGQMMSSTLDEELINRSAKILNVLSKRNNLSLFISAKGGLIAESSSPERTNLSKKVYYTSLKQLINGGLVEKSNGKYIHTTFGSVVYQSHIEGLIDQIRNQKQMMMIDTLKHSDQFSKNDINTFIDKLIGGINNQSEDVPSKIEIVFTYEDMVSAIVERTEFSKNEILLASRYYNEIIINNILRKAKAGINVKVIAEKRLVDQFFEQNKTHMQLNDKNAVERTKVVGNPWYPGNVSRRLANVPFSMALFDRSELAIELINANEPRSFHGAIFIRDEKTCKRMLEYYQKIWDSSSEEEEEDNIKLINETSASRRYYNSSSQSEE